MNSVIKSLSDELLKKQKAKANKPKKIDARDKALIVGLSQNKSMVAIAREMNLHFSSLTPRIKKLKAMGIDPYQHHTESELNSYMI